MKFAWIQAEKAHYPVRKLCRRLAVTPSGFCAWCKRPESAHTIKALVMALKRRCPEAGLLHHSDQGSTYASEDYQAMLDARGITCSMSRWGDCYDNAVMESFFSTVKSELTDRFDSFANAKMAVVRLHRSVL